MIYLLRHGEIEGAENKRFIGQADIPLSMKGLIQAEYWKKRLSALSFEKVYSSDLLRTKKTAKIISNHSKNKIILSKKLREINLGNWEGKLVSEIRLKFPDEWKKRGEDIAYYRTEKGECFSDLQNRVLPYFKKLVTNKKNLLIVTHAGVIRVILSNIMDIPLKDLFTIKLNYGALNKLKFQQNRLIIDSINILPESD